MITNYNSKWALHCPPHPAWTVDDAIESSVIETGFPKEQEKITNRGNQDVCLGTTLDAKNNIAIHHYRLSWPASLPPLQCFFLQHRHQSVSKATNHRPELPFLGERTIWWYQHSKRHFQSISILTKTHYQTTHTHNLSKITKLETRWIFDFEAVSDRTYGLSISLHDCSCQLL